MKERRGLVIEWICQKPKTNLPAYSLMRASSFFASRLTPTLNRVRPDHSVNGGSLLAIVVFQATSFLGD